MGDGTNDTPNLRDRFIYGVNTTYAAGNDGDLGATGGATTHSHTLVDTEVFFGALTGDSSHVVDGDKRRVSYGDSEIHVGNNDVNHLSWAKDATRADDNVYPYLQINPDIVISTPSHEPPYYKLAFIMKD